MSVPGKSLRTTCPSQFRSLDPQQIYDVCHGISQTSGCELPPRISPILSRFAIIISHRYMATPTRTGYIFSPEQLQIRLNRKAENWPMRKDFARALFWTRTWKRLRLEELTLNGSKTIMPKKPTLNKKVSWRVYQGGTGDPGSTKTDNYGDNSLEYFKAYRNDPVPRLLLGVLVNAFYRTNGGCQRKDRHQLRQIG